MKTLKSLALVLCFGTLMFATNVKIAKAQDQSSPQTQTQAAPDQNSDQGVNSTTPSTDQNTNSTDQSPDQSNSQLPQTASDLPLVGLMGVLSLAATGALGVLAKRSA